MIFNIMIGQRKCSYPGEYAPEALEVMDDDAIGDNEVYMIEKLKHYTESQEFNSIVTIRVNIPDGDIDAALFPKSKIFNCVPE